MFSFLRKPWLIQSLNMKLYRILFVNKKSWIFYWADISVELFPTSTDKVVIISSFTSLPKYHLLQTAISGYLQIFPPTPVALYFIILFYFLCETYPNAIKGERKTRYVYFATSFSLANLTTGSVNTCFPSLSYSLTKSLWLSSVHKGQECWGFLGKVFNFLLKGKVTQNEEFSWSQMRFLELRHPF